MRRFSRLGPDDTRTHKPKVAMAIVLGAVFAGTLIGTAVAGFRGATDRETLVRARVWCDALVARDALRYQETFRAGYFPGRFDRVANLYREPTEASILARMPVTSDCRVQGRPRGPDGRGEVFVTALRRGRGGDWVQVDLRMRRVAGFWVVNQLVPSE